MGKSILFLILSFYLSACTAISFVHNEEDSNTSFVANPRHTKKLTVSGEKEFYLWGLFHPAPQVNIDKIFRSEGVREASSVKLSVFQTNYQKFISWLSLGFFIPQSYQMSALTLEDL